MGAVNGGGDGGGGKERLGKVLSLLAQLFFSLFNHGFLQREKRRPPISNSEAMCAMFVGCRKGVIRAHFRVCLPASSTSCRGMGANKCQLRLDDINIICYYLTTC